ncbi:MAG: nitrite reductase, copper-containing [Elusimicrobia bacterium]|nr:nitrite reductase, copper-containing [Elusimicrobiota bacterium]
MRRLRQWTRTAAAIAALAMPLAAQEMAEAPISYAPEVPAPIQRDQPATLRLNLETSEVQGLLMEGISEPTEYIFWTFNGRVPGPFVRVRQGDTLELHLSNPKNSSMSHNIDLHAVTGPGGGAAITLAQPGETKIARMKMLKAGLYVYHCAAPPVTDHIANGMYGLILVEPPQGLPKVDREYYVLQSEFYTKEELGFEGLTTYDREKASEEKPTYVVFNGRYGGLTEDRALKAKVGEKTRIFFGNAGPNLVSSFHVIGEIFDKVYAEGAIESQPLANVQTTLVPAGGAAVVEFALEVPGSYTLVDHSIFRIEKGAVGALQVEGEEAPEIYSAVK